MSSKLRRGIQKCEEEDARRRKRRKVISIGAKLLKVKKALGS